MTSGPVPAARRTWKRPPFIKRPLLRWGLMVGAAVYITLALGTMDANWGRVADGMPRAYRFFSSFFPSI